MVRIVFDRINKFVEKMILKNSHTIVHMVDMEYRRVSFLNRINRCFAIQFLSSYRLCRCTFSQENKSAIHSSENLVAFSPPSLRMKIRIQIDSLEENRVRTIFHMIEGSCHFIFEEFAII